MHSRWIVPVVMSGALLVACTGGAGSSSQTATASADPATSAAAPDPTSSADPSADAPVTEPPVTETPVTELPVAERPVTEPTEWLCHPDLADDACDGDLDVTEITAEGEQRVVDFEPPTNPTLDCFYVYPTVSSAPTLNAPKESAPEIVFVARAQAALFQRHCRLFVPIYRQVSVQGLVDGGLTDPQARALAYGDVVSAFNDYLNQAPADRPFLLIGHSQGAMVLQQLIQEEIDGDADLRGRMAAAMLIGAGPWLAPDSDTVGTFQNIPPCQDDGQRACVIAYNSYAGTPPGTGLFGRIVDGRTVICTNPARLSGGSAPLTPIIPAESVTQIDVETGYVQLDDALTAECSTNRSHSWLDVTRPPTSLFPEAALSAGLGADWGLHRYDVTLALADLLLRASEYANPA